MENKNLVGFGALLKPTSLAIKKVDDINMKLYEPYIFEYSSDLIGYFCDGRHMTWKLIKCLIHNEIESMGSIYPAMTDSEKEVLETIFVNSSVIIRDIWSGSYPILGTRWYFGEDEILVVDRGP